MKLRDGPHADRPLVLLARARASDYLGDEVIAPKGEHSPARLAAYTEASEHAAAATKADPSSPLLALHAVLACYNATRNGASEEYSRALSLCRQGNEAALTALLPLSRLHHRMMSMLLHLQSLAASAQKAEGGGDVGDGSKKKKKKKGAGEGLLVGGGGGGGGMEVAAPSAGSAGEGSATAAAAAAAAAAVAASAGGSSAPPAPTTAAATEPQPSDSLTEVRAITYMIVCPTNDLCVCCR